MRALVPPQTCSEPTTPSASHLLCGLDAAGAAAAEDLIHALHLPPLPTLPTLPALADVEPPPLVLRALRHLGLDRKHAETGTFYDLQATDVLGATVDFHDFVGKVWAVGGAGSESRLLLAPGPPQCTPLRASRLRSQVVLLVNVAPHDPAAEKYYAELRQLCEEFGSQPGQPFRLLLLPCDQFLSLRQRWRPPPLLDDAGQLAFCCQHGLIPPTVRLLTKGDVNGAEASPVWTWLKDAYRDTSDIGGNFGKFLVRADGTVYCRYTPALGPAFLQPAIARLVAEGRREGRCVGEAQAEEGRSPVSDGGAARGEDSSAEMTPPPSWPGRAASGAPPEQAVSPRSSAEL